MMAARGSVLKKAALARVGGKQRLGAYKNGRFGGGGVIGGGARRLMEGENEVPEKQV